jgi:hypothetical protein
VKQHVRAGLRLAVAALAPALAGGCQYFDRLECRDVLVRITNSQQVTQPVNLAAPDEAFTDANLLHPGQSRELLLCLDRGESTRFRAGKDGREIGIVQCVPTKADYAGTFVSVIWTFQGFLCENW